MVEVCREQGLDATKADALSYLRGLPDGSLGGLFAAQVVEHLEPAYLTRPARRRVRRAAPGAPIVLETINPACWFAFFESYIRDITHVRPLHPDTLKFLLVATRLPAASRSATARPTRSTKSCSRSRRPPRSATRSRR